MARGWRTVRSSRGVQVAYELTLLGRSFYELARAAMDWTDRSRAAIEEAREHFDAQEQEWDYGARLAG